MEAFRASVICCWGKNDDDDDDDDGGGDDDAGDGGDDAVDIFYDDVGIDELVCVDYVDVHYVYVDVHDVLMLI